MTAIVTNHRRQFAFDVCKSKHLPLTTVRMVRSTNLLCKIVVGRGGLEPPTSRLSGVRSNQAELPTQCQSVQRLPYVSAAWRSMKGYEDGSADICSEELLR
jgi:hypothetical protein